MWLLAWLLSAALLCAHAFRSMPTSDLMVSRSPRSTELYARMRRLKGARKYHRKRPKKTTPAEIYPSPTLYYGNIQDYYGAPREYYAIPCSDALSVINSDAMVRLIGLIKRGVTHEELSREFESDDNFHARLLADLQRLRDIEEAQRCDVTRDLVIYFERVIKRPKEHPHFVDRAHALKRLQEFWRRREFARYRGLFKQVYWRMREIAAKLTYAGITFEDFRDPSLWKRYGVFKGLPQSTMVDNYITKHRIALNSDIRDFYFIDADTQDVRCVLDEGVSKCRRQPIDSLSQKVIDRIADDLKQLGIFPNDEWQTMNMSRLDELQRECSSEDAQRGYAIRDFYLTHMYPGYKVNGDPYYLESFVNHRYRTKTLERDLVEKYGNWVRSGARRSMPRPVGAKYQQIAIWKSLSRNKRRRLIQEFLYPKATSFAEKPEESPPRSTEGENVGDS